MRNTYRIHSIEELKALMELLGNIAADLPEEDEVDETPTNVDIPEETAPEKPIIEQLINGFLYHCKDEGRLPTYEEVQVIKTLDDILYRYNH